MSINLVLQSFGRENEYRRAILTIFSFYTYSSTPIADTTVVLFTDNPQYFESYLNEFPIQYIRLTPEKIKEMRGDIDFLHRMKIAVIEEAFTITKGAIIYADSDTFFIADPFPLTQQLSNEVAFMHLLEYPFVAEVEDKTETYRNFYQLINNQVFTLTNGKALKVTSSHCSWNAGVMFFHPAHVKFIKDVYKLTDQFYPSTGSHASEQYAFSIVIQEDTTLQPCDHVIYHYWYRVKKQITDQYLMERITDSWVRKRGQERLQDVKQWCNELPKLYDKHEWTVKDNAIQAFNKYEYANGYKWTAKALLQKPFHSGQFLKDVLYHTKKMIAGNGK